MFLLPLVFLSGMLFPMPPLPLFSMGSMSIGLYDLMPSTLASEVIRRAVGLGEPPAAWMGSLAGLAVEIAVVLAIGSFLYQRLRLERA